MTGGVTSGRDGAAGMTAKEIRAENERLDGALLDAAARVGPRHLHDAPEGEWSAAQVLAHLGEFPRFFAGELRRWQADRSATVGRTHEHPVRLAAVESPAGATDELVASARSALADLAEALELLDDADVDAPTTNVKYGQEPLSTFLDRYVLAHKAGHLDQLRGLAQEA